MPEEKVVNVSKVEVKKPEEKKVEPEEKKRSASISDIAETVEDPFCDEKNPRIISFQDVCQAAFMIKGGIDVTPCRVSFESRNAQKCFVHEVFKLFLQRSHLSEICGMEVYLKKEFQQFTGSFKERGARNCLLHLNAEQRKSGVVSASLGNHAQGLSYHGMKLNIPVTVVMPKEAPIMKIQKCRSFGANVLVQGDFSMIQFANRFLIFFYLLNQLGADMAAAKKIAMEISRDRKMPYIK